MKEWVWDNGENKHGVLAPSNKLGQTLQTYILQVSARKEMSEHDQCSTSGLDSSCLKSRYREWLPVDRGVYLSTFPEFICWVFDLIKNIAFGEEEKHFYKIMDPVTLFYLCKVPIVNKCLAFLPVTKYNFYAINYIS